MSKSQSKEQKASQATYFSIVSNAFLAIIKLCAGYFGNSYALIADAIESTTDVFSSMLVWFGIKYSNKPADENHPYGHGRAETLVTFLVVGFLIISATIIAYTSILNINKPHALPKPFTLVVLGLIIIWKEVSYRFVLKKSKETQSSALQADAWHHRSDAFTSLAAFLGISFALYMGKGYESADDWAALLASFFILYNAYYIFRPALGEIMDEHFYDDLIDDIRCLSKEVEGIIDTEKCYVRKTGMSYHIDLHAIVNAEISVREGHALAHRLKDHLMLKMPDLEDVLIHIEPDE